MSEGLEGSVDCHFSKMWICPIYFLIVTVNCKKYPSRYVKICCWQGCNGSRQQTITAKCRHVYLMNTTHLITPNHTTHHRIHRKGVLFSYFDILYHLYLVPGTVLVLVPAGTRRVTHTHKHKQTQTSIFLKNQYQYFYMYMYM